MSSRRGLENIFRKILERYARQNQWEGEAPVPVAAACLAEYISQEKIRPQPGEVPDAEAARWTLEVLAGIVPEWRGLLAVPVKQLLKAAGSVLLAVCRDTFREVGSDGICRRQQLARARLRTSGAHCIDCPYWTQLGRNSHREFFRAWWQGELAELDLSWDIYLPEDFRELRQWLADATT